MPTCPWLTQGVRTLLPLALLAFALPSIAGEITVLSGGAIEPGLRAATAAFERNSGHRVSITFNTAPQIQKRIEGGEIFDIVIAPQAVIDGLVKAGKVNAGGPGVGRVGLGVAVRDGAPVPEIGTTEALKKSVLDADAIVFNRASTGIYFEGLLRKLDVWTATEAKTTRYADGASVLDHVRNGKGRDIAFAAITEILLYKDKGIRFVGPLPPDVQNYTAYVASLSPQGGTSAAARDLAAYFATAQSKQLFVAAGVE